MLHRIPFVVACLMLCGQSCFAELALTVKDISLMLRSGYSSNAILAELPKRHFAGQLDLNGEDELKALSASPELIAALKNGQNAASPNEMTLRLTVPLQQTAEAKRIIQESMAQLHERAQQQSFVNQQSAQPNSDGYQAQLPSERERLQRYPMLTLSDLQSLTPSEMITINNKRQAKKDAEDRAAHEAWCELHPVECKEIDAAKSAAASARSDAETARSELQSLKTDLWMQGINR